MKKLTGYIAMFFGICIFSIAIFCGSLHFKKTMKITSQKDVSVPLESDKDNTDYGYAYETIYSGKPFVPDILFEYPFKKTDNYMSNTDFINKRGEECAAPIISKANDFTNAAFNVSYKNISNEDTFLDTLTEGVYVCFPSGKEAQGITEVTDLTTSWYINSCTSMEAVYTTDKCMLYYDENAVILRGLITFTVYESDDIETVGNFFELKQIKKGVEYNVVAEYYFVPSLYINDFDGYKISQIKFLAET